MQKLFIYLFMGLSMLSSCKNTEPLNSDEQKILFNSGWMFVIDSSQTPDELSEVLTWEKVQIPHTPVIEPLVVNNQWQGTCWYKKEINYQSTWQGKKLFLRFEGAMNVAEVWVYQTKKITHYGGYLPFVIEISEDLHPGETNTLFVKLNNEDSEVTGPKPLVNLDFNMYGGIYRDVFLLVKNQLHITDEQFAQKTAGGGVFVNYPKVSKEEATVSIKTNLKNSNDNPANIKIIQQLVSNGTVVSVEETHEEITANSDEDILQTITVTNPLLWSPQSPNLYQLITQIKMGGKIIDQQTIRIGIRKFEFKENKLYLNGEELFLRGVNRHQEYPYIGYALSNNANYRDAYIIKQAGFDYVRLSHYPHSPAFMDACDELGIVTIDAILGWQYYREHEPFREHVLQTCHDLVRRDRNHPSVLAWEVSLNESWMPEEFIDSLTSIAHAEYPFEDCYTAGWQRYGYDIFLQARQHRLGHDNNVIPDKPYIVSEYGDWEYYAQNAGLQQDSWSDLMPEERSSRQLLQSGEKNLLQQALNVQEAHNDNMTTPAVGDGYWDMFDYNRGYSDDLEASGIMSIFRLPKFASYFYQSQRPVGEQIFGEANKPMVFIASYNNQQSSNNIRIFSNCDEVELLHNGQSLGKQQHDKNSITGNLNHPPFTFTNATPKTGTLKAIGYINSKPVAEHEVTSAGTYTKIQIEADISGKDWESGYNDAIFVHAKVLDDENNPVSVNDVPVDFKVEGDAKIIGNPQPVTKAGIASVLIMAGDTPGDITITAKAINLPQQQLTIKTK